VNLIGPTITTILLWWFIFTEILALRRDSIPLLVLLGFIASLAIGVFIHEAAHLAIGLAFGRPTRKIRVGGGRTLFTFRPRGLRIQVCENPLGGGAVYFSGLDDASTDVKVITSAAGPGANLLAALYAVGTMHFGADWLGPFAVANLLLGVQNLIPTTVSLDGRETANDGLHILREILGTSRKTLYFEGGEMMPDANRVLIYALEETRDAGAPEVTDRQLLVGLARDRDIRVLLATVDLGPLMRSSGPPTSEDLKVTWAPVTDLVEKATFRVARDLGRVKPNAPCLCLGLMEVDCPAGRLLKEAGVSDTALRALAMSRPDEPSALESTPVLPDLPVERWGSAADRALSLAYKIAAADRGSQVGTEHILAALVSERTTRAALALDRLGFTLVRDDRAVLKREVPAASPTLSPQATAALVAALGRTGASYPTGTGQLCLGIADQGGGLGAMLLASGGVRTPALEKALRLTPREPGDGVGCTATSRVLWELRARARLGAGRYQDARADFVVLEQSAPSDAVRAMERNNIAWAALMSGNPSLRAEALEHSRAAVEVDHERLAYKGTYAFALMETGSPAEAAAILELVAPAHPRPRDRALDLCLLAICRARLGEPEAAASRLQDAAAADPRCQLLERARAEIAQAAAATTPEPV